MFSNDVWLSMFCQQLHMLCIPLLVNQAQRSYVSSTTRMRCLREVLSIMAQMVRGEEELLNKVIIFVFFVHKKYSCSFELMYK